VVAEQIVQALGLILADGIASLSTSLTWNLSENCPDRWIFEQAFIFYKNMQAAAFKIICVCSMFEQELWWAHGPKPFEF
jgi:hypothetical protein